MKQLIAFNRKKIYVSNTKPEIPNEGLMRRILTISEELKEFGYGFDEETVLRLTDGDLEDIHDEIIPYLQDYYHTSYGKDFKLLYPGFPQQVIDLDDYELWINSKKIYDEGVTVDQFIENYYNDHEKEELINNSPDKKLNLLKPITEEEFVKIPNEIMISANSLSDTTKEELVWFLKNYKDLQIPERIPFKETLCIVMRYKEDYIPANINDILRYGIYYMGGDPSLPGIPKKIKKNAWARSKMIDNPDWRNLKTLPRSERKHILGLINSLVISRGLSGLIPDAKVSRYYGSWVLLNERLHSGDYKDKFPEALSFFKELLTPSLCKKYKTWNSTVQEMYNNGENIQEITRFISKRPGELVRRIDSLLRRGLKTSEEGEIFETFLGTDGMNNKTLLELIEYYDKANSDAPRPIRYRGSGGKVHFLPPHEKLDPGFVDIIKETIERKILLNIDSRIAEKDLIGKFVYLDPEIKNVPIPVDMRSSTSYIPKGTTFDIPLEKNFVLFYTQWVQEAGKSEDLDLHAYLCNPDTNLSRNIGWNTGLKGEDLCAIHSGDVLDVPGNCQETILIDIDGSLKKGYKYVVATICNYKGRGFNTLPAWYGYSFDEKLHKILKNTITQDPVYQAPLECTSPNIVAFLIDLEKRSIMFLSLPVDKVPTFNLRSADLNKDVIKYFTAPKTFTSYEIMRQHFISRGATVLDTMPEEDEEIEVYESWPVEDVVNDYVKVLSMIGE